MNIKFSMKAIDVLASELLYLVIGLLPISGWTILSNAKEITQHKKWNASYLNHESSAVYSIVN